MKRLAVTLGVWAGCCLNAWAQTSPLPTLSAAEPMRFPVKVERIESVAVDGKGNAWFCDRGALAVLGFTPEGKALGSIKPPNGFQNPLLMSIEGDRLAVEDTNALLYLFSLPDGKEVGHLGPISLYNPAMGFLLTPHRYMFFGRGCRKESDIPTETSPGRTMTLFSTDLKGKDLVAAEEGTSTEEQLLSTMLFDQGYGVRWSDTLWAVTKCLPRQVKLVDEKGTVSKRSEPLGTLPKVTMADVTDLERQASISHSAPRVCGLLKVGKLLGILWQKPRPQEPQLEMEWMDGDLKVLGTTPVRLPSPLAPHDHILGAAANDRGTLYLVLVHRTGSMADPGTSTVYKVKVDLKG